MQSFLLTPLTITKENLEKELIDTGYYKYGDDGYPKAVSE